jgi:uncharacterized protein (DUF736 family)
VRAEALHLLVYGAWTGWIREREPRRPDFRIFAGHAELGAAWKHSKDGRDCLSFKLDDPSLKSEIKAILVAGDDGYKPVWNRQRKLRKPRRARKTED